MSPDLDTWVAIIDDDDAVRRSLTRFLRANDIRAKPFASADDYVRRSPGDLPRCIVLDAQLLRGMSAFALLDYIEAAGERVPVIIMTGQLELEPDLCARYPELRSCLRKPFEPSRLVLRIRRHLESAGQLRCGDGQSFTSTGSPAGRAF
jgi:FixJ family two-component response regulator